MNSIKQKLSRYISISISILLVTILLLTDVSVDGWISSEFDRTIINKSKFLTTLVSQDADGVEFEFADEFMPEFSGKKDPEYFQLWQDGVVFERSKTLDLFSVNHLPHLDTPLNQFKIISITLPDGRSGKMYFIKFKPHLEDEINFDSKIIEQEFINNQKTMALAYAISDADVEQVLWFVDIIFILFSLSAVIGVRVIVSSVVKRGLLPLDKLNNELKQINLNSENSELSTAKLPLELIPIAQGINHFLNENKVLYSREKRITSDIAHELKTPIAELLNLTEVAIKFPHEKQLSANYKTEVLDISVRLKNIVNGILLLQKSSSNAKLPKHNIDINVLINTIIERENLADRTIDLDINKNIGTIFTNEIAIETVLTNLLSNAIYYSPVNSIISISISQLVNNKVKLVMSNMSAHQYDESELEHFFEPLWQKDSSRTSSDRYGLGLAIVKSYCDNSDISLSVEITPQKQIAFTLII